MKIPKTFKMGAIEWQVKLVDELGGNMGQCDNKSATICLEKNSNKQVLAQTFCHELIHAFFYSSGKNDEHDEVLVDNLGHALHQFLEETYEE